MTGGEKGKSSYGTQRTVRVCSRHMHAYQRFWLMPKRTVFVSGTRHRPTHRPPFSPPLASCARRVAGLTRIIFTAYHRLNIDLRMVSSSVWTSTRPVLLSFTVSSLALPPRTGTPLSRSTDFLASRVRWYRLAEVKAVSAVVDVSTLRGKFFFAWIYSSRLLFAIIRL